METIRKIVIVSFSIFLFVFIGCATNKIEVKDTLVLAEITPLPKDVQLKKKVLYEPVYSIMRILEITLENGVQAELIAKIGDAKTGLENGVYGEISSASDFGEIIGTFKIISVANGFVICRIENVTKKIPNTAFIRVQIGQKEKEE
ncbi:MAG: hypothetical protein ACI4DS_07575 [Eubacterium sp.]